FAIDNGERPFAVFTPATTARSAAGDRVRLGIRVVDLDAAGTDALRLTLPSGAPLAGVTVISGATAGATGSGALLGIPSTPSGAEVEVEWNAAAQIGPFQGAQAVSVIATPFDRLFDAAGVEQAFHPA